MGSPNVSCTGRSFSTECCTGWNRQFGTCQVVVIRVRVVRVGSFPGGICPGGICPG